PGVCELVDDGFQLIEPEFALETLNLIAMHARVIAAICHLQVRAERTTQLRRQFVKQLVPIALDRLHVSAPRPREPRVLSQRGLRRTSRRPGAPRPRRVRIVAPRPTPTPKRPGHRTSATRIRPPD